jgi:hypothetical protein
MMFSGMQNDSLLPDRLHHSVTKHLDEMNKINKNLGIERSDR